MIEAQKVIKGIFDSMKIVLRKNLDADSTTSSFSLQLNEVGEKDFPFFLDDNGRCHFEVEEFGGGLTANCVVWFESPEAIYSLSIVVSDGGGGQWSNIQTNQKVEFEIRTSIWHKTKVTIDGRATVTNQNGRGKITFRI